MSGVSVEPLSGVVDRIRVLVHRISGKHGRIGFTGIAAQVDVSWHRHKPPEGPLGLMDNDFASVVPPAHQVQHLRGSLIESFELPDIHRSIMAGGGVCSKSQL